MKKVLAFLILALFTFALIACDDETYIPSEERGTTDLTIHFSDGSAQGGIQYAQGNPLTLPNGTTVTSGQLKPMWQMVEDLVDLRITAPHHGTTSAANMMDMAEARQFDTGHIFGGSNLAQRFMSLGQSGHFHDLSEHFDRMPNFQAYIEANPLVLQSMTAADGGIYHIPYIAEIGSFARMYHMRVEWVRFMLDGDTLPNLEQADLTNSINVAVEPFWFDTSASNLDVGGLRHSTNVIDLQNRAAVGGALNSQVALRVLRDYIDATYPQLANRSDLFLNDTALYDIDELVALFRVMRMFPMTLSREVYGTARANLVIAPFFSRQENHREELFRFISYFGGVRVHGSDSYGARFVIGPDGELFYSYHQPDFIDGLYRLRQWNSEGLIDSRMLRGGQNVNNEFRQTNFFNDNSATNQILGFMTYDFTASTTGNPNQTTVYAVLPPMTTTPVTGDQWIHWMENSRAIQSQAWAIASHVSGHQLQAALELFDFFFSQKGHLIQNYGIPSMWVEPNPELWNESNSFTNPWDGVVGPLFNEWALNGAVSFQNGNMSEFLRQHIGALLPIGYQKEIGFELQTTTEIGMASWALYNSENVNPWNNVPGVITMSYAADALFPFSPTVIALNSAEVGQIGQHTQMAGSAGGTALTDNLIFFVGGRTTAGVPQTRQDVTAMFEQLNSNLFELINRNAFNRNRT